MKRRFLLVCCISLFCILLSACNSDNEVEELYGLSKEKIAQIGATIYANYFEELPEEYMITDKIHIQPQGDTPRCMAYATAMVLRYLGEEISGDEVYYSIDNKLSDGRINVAVLAKWINELERYNAQLYMGTIENIKDSLNKGTPVIIYGYHSSDDMSLHGFIVTGYDNEFLYVADSAISFEEDTYYNRKIRYEEFEKMWSVDDELYHHLFIQVDKASEDSFEIKSDVKDSAFNTNTNKEYEEISLSNVDLSYYEPVTFIEDYIVFSHSEDVYAEYYSIYEIFLYDISSGEMRLIDTIRYLAEIEPAFFVHKDNLIFSIIECKENIKFTTSYYKLNIQDGILIKLKEEVEPVYSTFFGMDEENIIKYTGDKISKINLNGWTEKTILDYSQDSVEQVECLTTNAGNIIVIETISNESADYSAPMSWERYMRIYDFDGNLYSEIKLNPMLKLSNVTYLIDKIYVKENYICITDTNEGVAIYKFSDNCKKLYTMYSKNPNHYITCINSFTNVNRQNTNLLYFMSQVDESYYVFDSECQQMFSIKLQDEDAKLILVEENRALMSIGNDLSVLNFY